MYDRRPGIRHHISHQRRAGRRRGIEQMNALMDELRERALWLAPPVELAIVYQVAAKYLPNHSDQKDLTS